MIAFALSRNSRHGWSRSARRSSAAPACVAIIYSLLPIVPYRRTIQLAGTAAICFAFYQYGIGDAQAVREAAELRQQVATLNATVADREQRLAEYRIIVERRRRAEAQAQRDMQALQSRIDGHYDADVARAAAAESFWLCGASIGLALSRLCRLALGACPASGEK